VAAVPRWEPETVICIAWEPETVNRKGLQVTKSLEASPPLKNWRYRGGDLHVRNALETQNRCLEYATH
jgi:hypothetical protein